MIKSCVDDISLSAIRGWVFDDACRDTPITVEVVVNDRVVAEIVSDGYREDLEAIGFPPCAFWFERDGYAQEGDRICVRPKGSVVPLTNGLRDSQASAHYGWAWMKPMDMDDINRIIHDGVPVEKLLDRALAYHDFVFGHLLGGKAMPQAPKTLEIGSGVGWPIQAFLKRFPQGHVTGIDISSTMIERAKERLAAEGVVGYDFVHYDGRKFPLEENSFDIVYSYACLWHIPDVIMCNVLREALRVLKPGGVAIFHFLEFGGMVGDLDSQMAYQFDGVEGHLHYYRAPEQLARMLVGQLGATNFNLLNDGAHYWVSVSKGTGESFANKSLEDAIRGVDKAIACPMGQSVFSQILKL